MPRIIEIKDNPAKISLRLGCLVIECNQKVVVSLPTDEVGTLILSHPAISCTTAAISGLADAGGVILTCDSKWLPNGMLVPIRGNHIQTQRLRFQVDAKTPLKKRVWQSIIQQKIRNQSQALRILFKEDFDLEKLASFVNSGDTLNVEARAAKKYWRFVFGDKDFRRKDDSFTQNALLNYGYAVLRAVVARSICAVGLHPSIGIHHRNKYNQFCLADDLMEPFRPCVDIVAAKMLREDPRVDVECSKVRGQIISAVVGPWNIGGEKRSIFDASSKMVFSLLDSFESKTPRILTPQLLE